MPCGHRTHSPTRIKGRPNGGTRVECPRHAARPPHVPRVLDTQGRCRFLPQGGNMAGVYRSRPSGAGAGRLGSDEGVQPTPLPAEFTGASFRTADALAAGVQPGRLRTRDLIAPLHGLRAPASARPATLEERCLEVLPRLSGMHFFSHTTAAELWGIPLPLDTGTGPLHVSAIVPGREPRTGGIIRHRV